MKFIRTKKNNKGGVGKTILAYNTAVRFVKNGYKTVLIDLDSQCNLSEPALEIYLWKIFKAIFDFDKDKFPTGTIENIQKSDEEFQQLFENIKNILEEY